MSNLPVPHNETERLQALLGYRVLDTEFEETFDFLTQMAAEICEVPISLVSLIDQERQWFKSRVGLDAPETPRDISFCQYAIMGNEIFEVPDATLHETFKENPLVTGAPDIRFYAGAPLQTPEGLNVGTLCVIDRQPRKLSPEQKERLSALARQVIQLLELRLHSQKLHEALHIQTSQNSTLLQIKALQGRYIDCFGEEDKPMASVLGKILDFLGAASGALYIRNDEERAGFKLAAQRGEISLDLISEFSLSSGKEVFETSEGTFIPLFVQGRLQGFLFVLCSLKKESGDSHRQRLMLLQTLGLLVQNYRDVLAREKIEYELREQAEQRKIHDARMEMITTVLHDMGNAVAGISSRLASRIANSSWREVAETERLSQLLDQSGEELEAAFNGKAAPLRDFVRALSETVEDRHNAYVDDLKFYSKGVYHLEELLKYHRGTADHGSARNKQAYLLSEVLGDAITIVAPLAERQQIDLNVQIPSGFEKTSLKLDRTQIVRGLVNLLKNSIDSIVRSQTENGVLRIEAKGASNQLLIDICDNGEGADETLIRELNQAQVEGFHGEGLGLKSARSIIVAHGGSLKLHSEGPGKGMRTLVSLPRGQHERGS